MEDETEPEKPFAYHPRQPLHLSDLELSDSDESSGIDSTELNLEDFMVPIGKQYYLI